MINYIAKYFISFLIVGIISILTIDFIVLPSITQKKNEVFLPDVRLTDIEEAKEILKDFNLSVFYVDNNKNYKEGHVIETSPRSFSKVKKGRDVKIIVSAAKEDFIMGDYIDKSYRTIKLQFDRNNIIVDTTIYEYNESIKKDNIIFHYPKKGKKITDDTKLTLIVSSGKPPDYYVVPSLINLSYNSAIKKINESGLILGTTLYKTVDTLLNNTVIYQDQPAYKKLSMPIEINLTISKDE